MSMLQPTARSAVRRVAIRHRALVEVVLVGQMFYSQTSDVGKNADHDVERAQGT
jgi:hypothetical protein